MAYFRRKPPKGLVHHSDRGSQYASQEYQQMLESYGMICSMSSKADCRDNAVAEICGWALTDPAHELTRFRIDADPIAGSHIFGHQHHPAIGQGRGLVAVGGRRPLDDRCGLHDF